MTTDTPFIKRYYCDNCSTTFYGAAAFEDADTVNIIDIDYCPHCGSSDIRQIDE